MTLTFFSLLRFSSDLIISLFAAISISNLIMTSLVFFYDWIWTQLMSHQIGQVEMFGYYTTSLQKFWVHAIVRIPFLGHGNHF